MRSDGRPDSSCPCDRRRLATDAHLDAPVGVDTPASSVTRSSMSVAQMTDLGGPRRVVDGHHQAFAVDAHGLHVLGHGRPDDLRPVGEQAAQAPCVASTPSFFDTRPARRPGAGGRGPAPVRPLTGPVLGPGAGVPLGHVGAGRHGVDLVRGRTPLGAPTGRGEQRLARGQRRPPGPPTAGGSSSENTSSSRSTGGVPRRSVASWWAASSRARANDRCSPWEAWVRPGSPSDGEVQLVAVGARPTRPPARCPWRAPRPGRRATGPTRTAGTRVPPASAGRPAGVVRLGRAAPARRPVAPGPRPGRSRPRPAGCPTRPGWRPPRGEPAAAGCRSSAARWRRIRPLRRPSRASFGSMTARVSSRNRRRSAGPPRTTSMVLGGEHRGPEGLVEIPSAAHALAVDHGPRPAPTGRARPRWSGSGRPPGSRPAGWPARRPGAPWPPGATPGRTAGSTGSRPPRGRWSCRRR